MYYKGGNMLHTIRQIVNDDEKWRGILRGLNKTFYHQTVTSPQIEDYMSAQAGVNLSKVFDQYLRDVRIPTLEYKLEGKQLSYRWSNCVAGFEMPVKLKIGDNWKTLQPNSDWKTLKVSKASAVMIDPNFYVEIRKLE